MDAKVAKITLPGLQNRLDALSPGEQLGLAIDSYRRLFGENDIAQRRLVHFAKGHGCSTDVGPAVVVFRKL